MKGNMQLGPDVAGITIAVLVFALVLATVAIFWQAQTIAKQQAVIKMQLENQ